MGTKYEVEGWRSTGIQLLIGGGHENVNYEWHSICRTQYLIPALWALYKHRKEYGCVKLSLRGC